MRFRFDFLLFFYTFLGRASFRILRLTFEIRDPILTIRNSVWWKPIGARGFVVTCL
ncbi:hypothetical protein [Leptospira adleri]|uniref:hypothetical protein n=1 Tax=Leptospira adleri TaxID=2023186 RepID=UPI0013FE41C7|nr:hypothetical protein [Leptospira adleri]